ncbi:hypothetical protein CO669_09950 [Bradyrhizobium sp. Y36]|uniref:hypothetical protein n=1 Tax=Bradyrhizobium sp. Y36 TaxID=2035447 RepID=UPI000BE9FBDD|nr:hypothetical protein [Bradyrhizobium sp. Y36]PDT90493.1 hypothetical protein CO669_09950 [Bradyrhizobium sp. Y36]
MNDVLPASAIPDLLNRECFCITLDHDALCREVEREAGDREICASLARERPNLFSNAPVFLSEAVTRAMARIVRAIETVAEVPAYQDASLSWAPPIAARNFGPRGSFMGYDFHVGSGGPKLIEVNTNAGGAFLNALLAKAQRACCREVEAGLMRSHLDEFEPAVLRMFIDEWISQRGKGRPGRIAIVDDDPEGQYLYPEFLLARQFFLRHGIDAVIADSRALAYADGELRFGDRTIDLVYNRVVDFSLEKPEHAELRAAYLDGAVVVTPNPHVHALYADKRNLALLSDRALLQSWGVPADALQALTGVPRTVLVTSENAEYLWTTRKNWFFKPATGYGSKAVYRGAKVTKGVWAEIIQGGYVAQEFAAPSERIVRLDGMAEPRKMDVRLYVYHGRVLLTAARLYQGQATNFRTPGGGFAPVFVV